MKVKVFEVVLACLIVLMLGGILSSIKGSPSTDTTNIIEDFEEVSEYVTDGYVSSYIPEEDNTNFIGDINGKIGNGISTGINKTINWFFEMVKKLVS